MHVKSARKVGGCVARAGLVISATDRWDVVE